MSHCLLSTIGWQSNQVLLIAIGLGFLYQTGYRFSKQEPLSREETESVICAARLLPTDTTGLC